ncbi:MAG: carboxymuconolactone decarboxylase family protein [Acidimicrobiia bacterium]|nr:carboxymuconolactone decarboxylase family protein [Acidimicrobiia bacterium]
MARVRLFTEKTDDMTPEQQATFDWVVESRGSMIRPYEVMLHAPGIAQPMAELGAQVRYRSSLSDHDRELVIVTAAVAHGCAFEWDSHEPLARKAGVRSEVLDFLESGASVELTDGEAALIDFVNELCEASGVEDSTFAAAREHLGESGVVELAATVGYYTMLAYIMGACEAC